MSLDPERLQAALAGAAGGVFYGMFHLSTMLVAGATPSRNDLVLAGINAGFGIITGFLVAYFLAPAVAQMVKIQAVHDLQTIGFVIGAFAWELAPFAYRLARKRAANVGKGKL